MQCINCGTRNDKDALFCKRCGKNLNAASTESVVKTEEEIFAKEDDNKSKGNNKMAFFLIGGIVTVIAVAIILFIVFSGSLGPKRAVNEYMKAVRDGDFETMLNYRTPKSVRKDAMKEFENNHAGQTFEEVSEMYKNSSKEIMEDIESYSWKIEEIEKIGELDELKDIFKYKDLGDFRERVDEDFTSRSWGKDFDADEISEAYIVKVKLQIKRDDDVSGSFLYDIVYKCEGDWYMFTGFKVWRNE